MSRVIVWLPALVLVVGSLSSSAAEPPVKLFDGRSLEGWECVSVDPNAKACEVWSVKDGVLIGKGTPHGYIATKKDYTNFRLLVEWCWPQGKEPGTSGVLMRMTGQPKSLPKCVKAQLQHENAGDVWAFQGFKINGEPARTVRKTHRDGGAVTGVRKTKGNEKKPGEWNTYEITADGGTITLVVNGEKLNQATDCEVVPGKIALQSEGGEIHFRRVEITPIGK